MSASTIPPPPDDDADTLVDWAFRWPDEVPTAPDLEAVDDAPETVRWPTS